MDVTVLLSRHLDITKSETPMNKLVNVKQPSKPTLSKAFCSTEPPPPQHSVSNSPLSHSINAIPMGKRGANYILRRQCLQLIDRVKIWVFFPVYYNLFNSMHIHEMKRSHRNIFLTGSVIVYVVLQRSWIQTQNV